MKITLEIWTKTRLTNYKCNINYKLLHSFNKIKKITYKVEKHEM